MFLHAFPPGFLHYKTFKRVSFIPNQNSLQLHLDIIKILPLTLDEAVTLSHPESVKWRDYPVFKRGKI